MNQRFFAVSGLFIVALCLSPIVTAKEPAGFTSSLFDGKSLAGWHVTDCECEVQDGAILLKSGNGFVRTDHRYGDFVLDLEWKALHDFKWDSGIYFRCKLPSAGRPWPKRYQANLLRGREGDVGGVKQATSKGLTKPGQWNRFRLTVIGTTASMEINGKQAWKADGIEASSGYIGLQAEVPGGGQFLFRNINITELGFTSLFNGKDLTGWEDIGTKDKECWTVENGELVCTENKGKWLRSCQQYDNMNLRLQYKLKQGGNSGVYVRVPADGNHHGKDAGVEIQILDDRAKKHAKLAPYQYGGSVYKIAASTKRVGREPGQWNTLEINTNDADYRITHNGVVIVDAKLEEFPLLAERLKKGYLGLQYHGGGVWFRNLRIGPPQP